MIEIVIIVLLSVVVGGLLLMLLRRGGAKAPVTQVYTTALADRVRSVGKLVGLEVHAKEIATQTKGWSWVPPLLLSQAKIAMIFQFEKQYFIDLSKLKARDVEMIESGADAGSERARYRLTLPMVEGALRLTDVSPYDIQAGRVLGLFDVIQMDAKTQRELMHSAQEQASELFHKGEGRYIDSARRSIEHHLEALFRMFDVQVDVVWHDGRQSDTGPVRMELGETMTAALNKGQ